MESIIETNKSVMTPTEYVAWLETTVANLLRTTDQLEREVFFLVRKNMQLEDTEIATTVALLKNPLLTKQYRV